MRTKAIILLAFAALLILPQYAFADLTFSYTNSTEVDSTGTSIVNTALTEPDAPPQTTVSANVTSPVPSAPAQDIQVPNPQESSQTVPSTSNSSATVPAVPPTVPAVPIVPHTASAQPSTQVPASTPTAQPVPNAAPYTNNEYDHRTETVPLPLKTVVEQWANNKASDSEFMHNIQQFMGKDGTGIPLSGYHGPIPQWIRDDAVLWSNGTIDYKTFSSEIQYWISHDYVAPAPVSSVPDITPVTAVTQDTTATAITPNTVTVSSGESVTFTVTVSDTSSSPVALTGVVSWSDNGAGGTFSPSTCVISENSCSLGYVPPPGSSNITITATYAGDLSHYGSSGTALVLADALPTATSYTMNLQTDKSSYNPGDNVTITAYPAGAQDGQNVAIVVTDPSLNIVASRAVQVDTQGDAILEIGLSPDALAGTYQITSTALVGGNYVKGNAEFTVSSQAVQPSGVSIVSVQPTDQEGNNVVTSFGKGSTGYAKIVLSSASNQPALITVNLAGPDGTSLGVGSIKTSLGAGDSEIVISFFVPSDASVGIGNIYADMFSDWPSNGGTPLTTESLGSVGIT